MASLAKQLQRDLQKNPKKAGMLLLLCAVCAWFWGPLIFPNDESKVKPGKAGAASPVAAAAVPDVMKPVAAAPAIDWKLLAERLISDSHMTGAPPRKPKPGEMARNPFAASVSAPADSTAEELELLAAELAAEELRAEAAAKQMNEQAAAGDVAAWQNMPLELSSTLVGPRGRKAVINGRAFTAGTAIGKLGTSEIRLESVTPRSAVLVWNGTRRELRIPKPGEMPPAETSAAAARESSSELESLEQESEAVGTNGLEPAAANAL
ncbi:MAG: hypothetical protein C0483_14405 [Pirellula sp.]|nr:hypothetical protein [Pirellula sp.]